MNQDNNHCPHCGIEKIAGNERCHYCGYVFNEPNNFNYSTNIYSNENIQTSISINNNTGIGCLGHIIFFMFLGPFFLAGIILLVIGIGYTIYQHNQIKDYGSTTGTLNEFYNCNQVEYGVCDAKYKYVVDDQEYFVSSNVSTNPENFNKTETIYYNQDNPDKALIENDFSYLILIGGIFLSISIIVYIIIRKVVKSIKISINKSNP